MSNNTHFARRFSPAIAYSKEVSPICLPEQDEAIAAGASCYAMGWGSGSKKPELLYQVIYNKTHIRIMGIEVPFSTSNK